jgi:predicted 3-demethylubiquinone-9 3-methyltransferase (glyoxalase superfamily)
MQKITPYLWFDGKLEEAMNFYVSIFKNAKIINSHHIGPGMMTATFEIEGQRFMGLDAGPKFKFTEAISFFVNCKTQEEVDDLWEQLSAGGQKSMCGWLKDKYGLSWQIIPSALGELMNDPNPIKSRNVMNAILKMSKIEIKELQKAYDSE